MLGLNFRQEFQGLDHPLVQAAIRKWQDVGPERIGYAVAGPDGPGVLTWWMVETTCPSGERRARVLLLAVGEDGRRNARLERAESGIFDRRGDLNRTPSPAARRKLLHEQIEPMLERDLQHRQIVPAGGSYAAKLIGWVEVASP